MTMHKRLMQTDVFNAPANVCAMPVLENAALAQVFFVATRKTQLLPMFSSWPFGSGFCKPQYSQLPAIVFAMSTLADAALAEVFFVAAHEAAAPAGVFVVATYEDADPVNVFGCKAKPLVEP